MKEFIIVSNVKSNKSDNMVWMVSITGQHYAKAHCKSAFSAMKFAFLLKARTGLDISDNCLCRLSHEIAKQKAARAAEAKEKMEAFAEEHSVDTVLAKEAPKTKRRKSTKKSAKAAAQ